MVIETRFPHPIVRPVLATNYPGVQIDDRATRRIDGREVLYYRRYLPHPATNHNCFIGLRNSDLLIPERRRTEPAYEELLRGYRLSLS